MVGTRERQWGLYGGGSEAAAIAIVVVLSSGAPIIQHHAFFFIHLKFYNILYILQNFPNYFTTLQGRYHGERKTMTTPWPINIKTSKLIYLHTANYERLKTNGNCTTLSAKNFGVTNFRTKTRPKIYLYEIVRKFVTPKIFA